MKPEVTVIVVNWNSGENLKRCLEALLEGKTELSLQIVVVDNGSSDHSLQAADCYAGVKLIQTGENLGFGRAINRGISATEGTYLAVMNPDVVLEDHALDNLVENLESNALAGIAGPLLYNAQGQVLASCGEAPRLVDEICRKFLLHLVLPLFKFRRKRPRHPEEVGWVTGACFVARRSALEAVGGMDEAIFMYYEDVDLCLRLKENDWCTFYVPDARAMHLGGESSRLALDRMLVVSESSYTHLITKHLGKEAARILCVLRPLEMGLRLVLWGVLYFGFPPKRVEARQRLRAYWEILNSWCKITTLDLQR